MPKQPQDHLTSAAPSELRAEAAPPDGAELLRRPVDLDEVEMAELTDTAVTALQATGLDLPGSGGEPAAGGVAADTKALLVMATLARDLLPSYAFDPAAYEAWRKQSKRGGRLLLWYLEQVGKLVASPS